MATKGVLIDFNKKYRMVNGTKVLRLEKNRRVDKDIYPITAFCYGFNLEGEPQEIGHDYTADGFFRLGNIPCEFDLILDETGNQKSLRKDYLYSEVCTAVLEYGDLVSQNNLKINYRTNPHEIEIIKLENRNKYHELMRLIIKYANYTEE